MDKNLSEPACSKIKIKGAIDAIAFGGQGILRDNGFVVFVPFTAPGDFVEIELTSKKKQFGEGKLLHLIEPSPLRTEPRCPYFGVCGGCQFQHLSYSAQLEMKRKFIEDALKRIAHAPIGVGPVIPSEKNWAYREHIRLNIRLQNQMLIAGYVGQEHNTFLSVSQCPIFHPENDPLLIDLHNFLAQLDQENDPPLHVRIFKQSNQYLLIFSFSGKIAKDLNAKAERALQTYSTWKGIILSSPHETIHVGKTQCSFEIFGLKLHYSPFGFIQNHADQSKKLYQYILDEVPSNAKRVLDLYSGIGVTSLLLANKGIETLGIESHPDTVAMAEQNAKMNGLDRAAFYCGKAESVIGRFLKQHSYDVVLLNPPRTGLDARVISEVATASPERLIYVSCMPSTLARDIAQFLKNGYQIEHVQGFDMFPQTTHVETVITLVKNPI
ncbi:MAG: 23S rRNA (uracil(1939)-C(5))-methyltransferase RlmD [Parachlamydiales bacterium]|nr:23S rRNA (uracil(1939)-C(5))-methyltransferase RlmD [Candidatus Acheromyda pituitae]